MNGFCFAIPFSYNQSLFAVPLATLQSLQAGQGIPTGTPGHLLVKTETGQYQILRVGPPGGGAATPAPAATATPSPQQQQTTAAATTPAVVRPAAAAAAAPPPSSPAVRLPTQPVAISRAPAAAPAASSPAPAAVSAAGAGAGGMGQQMTPDTAKIKCKNFLATLLRLASEQPESVARNVRTLIQVRRVTTK